MELLFPGKNYSISNNILQYRPRLAVEGTRSFSLASAESEAERRSKFSFAVMDMLQVSAGTKLLLLQEHVLEKRYGTFVKVLERGGRYLQDELVNRGMSPHETIQKLTSEISMADESDFVSPATWFPENYINGQWEQRPMRM
jgi:hypothetical protein